MQVYCWVTQWKNRKSSRITTKLLWTNINEMLFGSVYATSSRLQCESKKSPWLTLHITVEWKLQLYSKCHCLSIAWKERYTVDASF